MQVAKKATTIMTSVKSTDIFCSLGYNVKRHQIKDFLCPLSGSGLNPPKNSQNPIKDLQNQTQKLQQSCHLMLL